MHMYIYMYVCVYICIYACMCVRMGVPRWARGHLPLNFGEPFTKFCLPSNFLAMGSYETVKIVVVLFLSTPSLVPETTM